MIKKTIITSPFDVEIQPDGTSVTTIDAYDGCQIQCPYCFQRNNEEWSKRINIRVNIIDIMKESIDINNDGKLYIGSLSDPYMDIEEEYQLTRGLLDVLKDTNYQVMITTKAINNLILRDVQLFKAFNIKPVIMIGLSDIEEARKGKDCNNIKVLNEMHQNGLNVQAFITPILPYIMDIDSMISAIDKDIDIYIDKLRVFTKGKQNDRMYEWIKKYYPIYTEEYYSILYEENEDYYKLIYEKYKSDKGITFMADLWNV